MNLNLQDTDILYILGDVVDRGWKPMEILQDMMSRPNVIPIAGNHDMIAREIMGDFLLEMDIDHVKTMLEQANRRCKQNCLSD